MPSCARRRVTSFDKQQVLSSPWQPLTASVPPSAVALHHHHTTTDSTTTHTVLIIIIITAFRGLSEQMGLEMSFEGIHSTAKSNIRW